MVPSILCGKGAISEVLKMAVTFPWWAKKEWWAAWWHKKAWAKKVASWWAKKEWKKGSGEVDKKVMRLLCKACCRKLR